MKRVKMNKKGWLLIMGAVVLFIPGLVFGQGNPPAKQGESEAYRLSEAEIKGELKDVMGNMRLLESEIVGSLERPRLSFSLPWQDAFLPIGPEKTGEGDLLGEAYPFVDPKSLEY